MPKNAIGALQALGERSEGVLGLEWHFAPRSPFLLVEDGSRAVYGWQRSEGRLRRLVEGLTLASVTLHLVRLGRTGPKR